MLLNPAASLLAVLDVQKFRVCRIENFYMFLGIIKKSCAKTHPVVVAFQDAVIPASLAAFPEFRIVSQGGECHGTESKLVIHFHHCSTGSDAEDLCFWEKCPRVFEDLSLYPHGESYASEGVGYDETGIGDIFLASPGLNVGETGKPSVLVYGNYGFSRKYLFRDIFRSSSCYTCAPFSGRYQDFFADLICVYNVACISHHNINVHGCLIQKNINIYADCPL